MHYLHSADAPPFTAAIQTIGAGVPMANEIEHKYLVDTSLWHPTTEDVLYRQGYLSSVKERVVRVRVAGEKGFLTVKGESAKLSRLEFEYPIPVADAHAMLDLC